MSPLTIMTSYAESLVITTNCTPPVDYNVLGDSGASCLFTVAYTVGLYLQRSSGDETTSERVSAVGRPAHRDQ